MVISSATTSLRVEPTEHCRLPKLSCAGRREGWRRRRGQCGWVHGWGRRRWGDAPFSAGHLVVHIRPSRALSAIWLTLMPRVAARRAALALPTIACTANRANLAVACFMVPAWIAGLAAVLHHALVWAVLSLIRVAPCAVRPPLLGLVGARSARLGCANTLHALVASGTRSARAPARKTHLRAVSSAGATHRVPAALRAVVTFRAASRAPWGTLIVVACGIAKEAGEAV